MDIQVSSNFERFLFEASGRDAAFVRAKIRRLGEVRALALDGALPAYQRAFRAERVDTAAVRDCICRVKAESGYLLDPHSACGVVAAQRTLPALPSDVPLVALATAHAAKFPETMLAITGERPQLPARLHRLMTAKERVVLLPNDLAAVQSFVAQRAARGQGAVHDG
jgi:threonine synthase